MFHCDITQGNVNDTLVRHTRYQTRNNAIAHGFDVGKVNITYYSRATLFSITHIYKDRCNDSLHNNVTETKMLYQAPVSALDSNACQACHRSRCHLVILRAPVPHVAFTGATYHDITHGYISKTGIRSRAKLNWVTIGGYYTVAHCNVFWHEVWIITLQTDAIVVTLNQAIGNRDILRIYVDAVVIALQQTIDTDVVYTYSITPKQAQRPAVDVTQLDISDRHISAILEMNAQRTDIIIYHKTSSDVVKMTCLTINHSLSRDTCILNTFGINKCTYRIIGWNISTT